MNLKHKKLKNNRKNLSIVLIVTIFLGFFATIALPAIADEKEIKSFHPYPSAYAHTPKLIPHEIYFNWGPGSDAITMYDPCTKQPLTTPEFIYPKRNNPAAYVRGNHVTVMIKFTTREPMPDTIMMHDVAWTWGYKLSYNASWTKIGTSHHTVYAVNKEPLVSPVYKELVEWTTEWCTGMPDDDKQIADAIIEGFNSSGVIKYGAAGWDTAEILCSGDGMCGGMKEVFYDACGTQGVHVTRFCYLLYDADPGAQELWDGIVSQAPGLGREEPTYSPRTCRWVDSASAYPCPLFDVKSLIIPDRIGTQDQIKYYFSIQDKGIGTSKEATQPLDVVSAMQDKDKTETVDANESAKAIERVKAMLQAEDEAVNWVSIRDAILQLGELKEESCEQSLVQLLAREKELTLTHDSPLPGAMPPLETLKATAIWTLKEIHAKDSIEEIKAVYHTTENQALRDIAREAINALGGEVKFVKKNNLTKAFYQNV